MLVSQAKNDRSNKERPGPSSGARSLSLIQRDQGALFGPGHAAYITTNILQRVVQSLNDVHTIVGKSARILGTELVVVSRPQQARSPCFVSVVTDRLVGIGFAIAVCIRKEVWVAPRIVDNSITSLVAIRLNGRIERLTYGADFLGQTFSRVAIAVKVV